MGCWNTWGDEFSFLMEFVPTGLAEYQTGPPAHFPGIRQKFWLMLYHGYCAQISGATEEASTITNDAGSMFLLYFSCSIAYLKHTSQ